MHRRSFVTLLSTAAAAPAWPLAARAQQAALPVIGVLDLGPAPQSSPLAAALRRGLAQAGYIQGQNVAIEYRSGNMSAASLPQLAADLVKRQVAVIVTTGSPSAAVAAKAATSTIPIVFSMSEDPLKYGLVASYNRPGGNATGVNFLSTELFGKRLDLLIQLVPQATRVAYLMGPRGSPVFEEMKTDMLAAGRSLGREIIVIEVRRFNFEASFAALAEQGAEALVVGNFTYFNGHESKIIELAGSHKVPAIYPRRGYAVRGGLMSYSTDGVDTFRQALVGYVVRILKGEKPADLPVQQPTKFEFVINLKTAKSLDIEIPPPLLVFANEVIE